MIYLLWSCMFLFTYVCGRGFLLVADKRKKKESGYIDAILTGVLIGIGACEAAYLTALFLKWRFAECMRLMRILFALLFVLGLAVCLWDRARQKRVPVKLYKEDGSNRTSYYLGFITLVIIVIQFVIIQVNEHVYLDGDMTVETVNTLLYTDRISGIDPLTGNEIENGVPLRIQILCIPALYAFLTETFHMSTIEVVWQGIPAFILLCSYLAFWEIAKIFFPENNIRRNLFMLLIAFLMTVGDYKLGMDGFLLLQSGFRPTAVRALVILPFAVSALFRKRWLLTCMCVIAEACITWTLYGAGVCLLVSVGILIVEKVLKKRDII